MSHDALLEDRYQLLVEAVVDYAIFIVDPKGFVATWNAGAQRMKGYTREEIIGRHFSVFYPREAVSTGWPELELRHARQQGRFEDEGWRVRKDGSRFWANVVITAMYETSGTLVGFAKVTHDLTERRRYEEELRASEEHFRMLVENVHDHAVFMLDVNGTVRTWNAGAQALKGYTGVEIIGRHFSEFYTPQDQLEGKPSAELRAARANGRLEDEGWRVRKDGTLFWANVLITAIYRGSGELIGFAKVTRDMTAPRRLEALERSGRRMRELLAMLLKVKLQKDLLRVGEIVSGSIETARPAIDARNHMLSVELPQLPIYVDGDAPRLSQIVQTLLVNAARYTAAGGRIEVKVEAAGGFATISVSDNGSGIAADDLETIFEVFMVDNHRPKENGLGIELALARSLAERHGGTLDAHSPGPGQGSTFVLRLPTVRRKADRTPAS
jgi:PAS domain S-box-containing protein